MQIRRKQSRSCRKAWAAMGALLVSAGAYAAGPGTQTHADRQAQYLKDRAACESGQTGQDLQTCLREAGAVRNEAPRPQPPSDPATLERNATQRCASLPPDRQAECRQLMLSGQARTLGSVPAGGVLREITVPVAPAPTSVTPAGTVPGATPAPGTAAPAPMPAPGTTTSPSVLPATPVTPR